MANGNQDQVVVWSPPDKQTGKVTRGTVPKAQLQQALGEGYKPADSYIEAVHPKTGQSGIIPKEQWSAAQAEGFTLAPRVQAQQQTQAQAGAMQQTPSLGQRLDKWYTTPTPNWSPEAQMAMDAGADEEKAMPYSSSPQQTYQRGAMILGAEGLPALGVGALAAPGATLGSVAGGAGLGYLAKKGVKAAGGGPFAQDVAEAGGGIVGGTVGGLAGSGTEALVRGAVQRLSGATPAQIAAIEQGTQYEARIAQRIVRSEDASRTAFKNAYDSLGIDAAPVNMAGPKNIAQSAVESLPKTGASVPRPVSTVAGLPEPSEANLPDYILSRQDPNEVLAALSKSDTIPFRQAQQTRSAIETFISRARGRLPAETYNALKSVSNAIGGGLEATAQNEGKLGGYQAADAMFKQHAADYWNDNSPLGGILDKAKAYVGAVNNNQQPEAGSVLKEIKDPASAARVVDAMRRRVLDTSEIQQLVAGGKAKLGKLAEDIGAMSLSKQFGGPQMFNQQAAAATRAQLRKYALGTVASGAGLGTLYELYRMLSRTR
ncbi:MAG TPA: hypothetical protein VF748_16055 [Candidatus Acidoferrum sp.]